MPKRALVLFAHGARDPRWAEPFRRLQALVQSRESGVRVELAFLELMEPQLPELVAALLREQCRDVTVVPVFFGQGGHVLRDLPAMVERLRQAHPELALRVAPAVGEDEAVLGAIAHYCVSQLEG